MEIGRFAAVSGLSVPALRHYDEVGILKPTSVDPQTSYRRYPPDQLGDARLICSLRGVDLPLEEIRAVLAADSEPEVQDILTGHRRRLAERVDRLERMLATSATYVDRGVPLPTPQWLPGRPGRGQHPGPCPVGSLLLRGVRPRVPGRLLLLRARRVRHRLLLPADHRELAGRRRRRRRSGCWSTTSTYAIAGRSTHGATEVSPPTDYEWKPRSSVIDDPSGNRIQLSQA